MTKKWAVGFSSYFDNELIIEIIIAPSWPEAIDLHSRATNFEFDRSNLNTAKRDFFDADAVIDVVEIST